MEPEFDDDENLELLGDAAPIPDDSPNCSVCLSPIDNTVNTKTTDRCQHTFHRECLDRWLETHNTCPECRVVLFSVHDLPVPPGREPEEYLCVCNGMYACYFPWAMRECSSLFYLIFGCIMGYMLFQNIYYFKPPADFWFISSTILQSTLLVVDIVLYIMLKCRIQCRDLRFSRVNPQDDLPV